jgi:hypothetical protein
MDAFKLAFETVLVGALAFPWLALMMVLLNRNLASSVRLVARIVPKPCVPAAVGVVAFSFAYVLGSAISPVAQQFLNDMDSIGLPTQDRIQARIVGTAVRAATWNVEPASLGRNREGGDKLLLATGIIFRRQESTVLLTNGDASERLNRLHERLTVLSGATFSGFALLVLCVFASCSGWRSRVQAVEAQSRWRRRTRRWAAFAPCTAIGLWGVLNFARDWHKHSVDDPPILEAVLLVLGGFGLWVTAHRTPVIPSLRGKILFVAFLTLLCFGGYISTEPTYVHDVIDSYAAMKSARVSFEPHPATPGVMADTLYEASPAE